MPITILDALKSPKSDTLSSIMGRSAPTLDVDRTVNFAKAYLKEKGEHYLVVTKRDEIVGVLCMCDLEDANGEESVEACIHAAVVLISSVDSFEQAAVKMFKEGVGCLPVMLQGKMLGFVTKTHLKKSGLSQEVLSTLPVCSSCQSDEHVRLIDGCRLMSFCRDCLRHMNEVIPHAECGGQG